MYEIAFTIADLESSTLTTPRTSFIDARTEQEAWKIFHELMYEQEGLFSLTLRNTDLPPTRTPYSIDYLQILSRREQLIQFKESLIELEKI